MEAVEQPADSVLERLGGCREERSRVVDSAVRPRIAAQQPPGGLRRARARRRACAARPAAYSRAGRVVLAGVRRAPSQAAEHEAARYERRIRGLTPTRSAAPPPFPSTSSTRSSSQLVAARLGRLREAGAHDEHVVVRRGTPLESSFARQISRSWRLMRLRTTALPTAFGTAKPSRGSPSALVALRTSRASGSASRRSGRAGRPRRSRASVRDGSAAAPLTPRGACGPSRGGASGSGGPARVDMRARKPCLRFRLRTFG